MLYFTFSTPSIFKLLLLLIQTVLGKDKYLHIWLFYSFLFKLSLGFN